MFQFSENTVKYTHMARQQPKKVKINGNPWQDLSEPFVLDKKYDFSKARLISWYRRPGAKISGTRDAMGFDLLFDNGSNAALIYKADILCPSLE